MNLRRLFAIILTLGILFSPLAVLAADDTSTTTPTATATTTATTTDSSDDPDTINSYSDYVTSGYDLFSPPISDKSINYLGQVFGTVGGVIHGTSGQLLSEVFEVFNYGMVVLAGCFIIYTVILTVIGTATDGEIMGKKLNSAWIIFRTALGIGILVPKYTGYSLIQVFIMWVVVQGVGLADNIWERALDYLGNEGGVVYVQPASGNSMKKSLTSADQIYDSSICLYKLEDIAKQNKQSAQDALKNDPTNPTLQAQANASVPSYHPIWDDDNKLVKFGYESSSKGSETICGSYSWAKTGKQSDAYEQYKRAGLDQMILDLSYTAKAVVQSQSQTLTDDQKQNMQDRVTSSILGATADYENILMPALRGAKDDSNTDWKSNLAEARDKGWIVAGSYYWDLARINNEIDSSMKDYQPTPVDSISNDMSPYGINTDEVNDSISSAEQYVDMQNLQTLLVMLEDNIGTAISPADMASLMNAVKDMSAKEQKQFWDKAKQSMPSDQHTFSGTDKVAMIGGATAAGVGVVVASQASPPIGLLMANMYTALVSLLGTWFSVMNSPGDPLAMVQTLGRSMVGIAVTFWIVMSVSIGGLVTLLSMGNSMSGAAFGVQSSLKLFMPVVIGFMLSLFVNGMVLSVYIPLIPFLIFTFAAIGWLISVLEAMVAGPLVAFGITHPEGHDLLGKAEQSVMLLLGVFLRPAVMVIGFLAAMILARVSLRVINAGFSHITESANITLSGVNIFGTMGLMLIYTLIVISLINVVFNAGVVKLWETIWMWIGFHQPSSSADQALSEIKGGFSGGAQVMGDATGSMIKGGGEHRSGQIEKGVISRNTGAKGKLDRWQYNADNSGTSVTQDNTKSNTNSST